jgi:hypothetical protein
VHGGDLRRVGARGSTCGLVEEVVPDGADGNGRIGQSVRVQISDAPTTVPAVEFFNDDVLDVVSNARISKTSQNGGCFGRERVGPHCMDAQRVQRDKDLNQVVMQLAITCAEALSLLPT